MAEQTSQEPTMEEILASIRRIISEDEAPDAKAETAPQGDEPPTPDEAPAPEPVRAAEPEPEPAPPPPEPEPVQAAAQPAPEPEAEEDEPLELTEKVETHGDLDVYTPPEAEPAPVQPAEAPAAAAPAPHESLVSDRAAEAAASAFGKLAATIAMPAEGRTLEDVVRELLKPLLQQWLDDNLPAIVQTAVEAEVERISRARVR